MLYFADTDIDSVSIYLISRYMFLMSAIAGAGNHNFHRLAAALGRAGTVLYNSYDLAAAFA